MPSGDFGVLCSKDLLGKYVAMLWYPADFSFVCPTEVTAFNDAYDKFQHYGCEVIAASCDSKYSHLAFTEKSCKEGGVGKLNFPLISDANRAIAQSFGILDPVSGFAKRALFIVSDKGMVRHAVISDSAIGRSVDEALRVVAACRYSDQHGEVCPANWHPGKKGIVTEPKAAKEFFKAEA
ncbi:natural killer cell enhancement factor [Tribonema minus]|uniref:Natural killer cell enhancement factor n=1 Tax=Tribonema minus TaxID=303371 RepID=A0A835YSL3_9STRA|nr:natural killer cell enhancement factor [Tribonema minus]